MKVLLLANINSTHTKKWALALKDQGLVVGIFSLHAPLLNDPWYKNLDHVYFPSSNKGVLLLRYTRFFFDLRKTITVFEPDILHSHFVTNYSFLANLSGFVPHVVTTWGSDVFSFPKKNLFNARLIRFNLKKATAVISTSHVMAKELMLYTTKEVQVIPFGIDFDRYKNLPKKESTAKKTIRIGCFKKIEHIYGTDVLIRAFDLASKELADYDLKLQIVGDGTLLQEMKVLVKELGLENKIEFSGWVNADRVPDLLGNMDICMYLSRHESFGVSLLEAMAAGVPLIVTRTPGFMEVAGTTENAVMVDIDDPEQSAAGLVELITNRERYENIKVHAYAHAKEKYDLKNNIKLQVAFYEKLMRDANKTRPSA